MSDFFGYSVNLHIASGTGEIVAERKKKLMELGQAASENSQAQYFMALSKANSRKKRSHAGWDIAVRAFTIAKDTFFFNTWEAL